MSANWSPRLLRRHWTSGRWPVGARRPRQSTRSVRSQSQEPGARSQEQEIRWRCYSACLIVESEDERMRSP
eukprot:scaffold14838_cov101-Isochrysis_galbana.AAC.6